MLQSREEIRDDMRRHVQDVKGCRNLCRVIGANEMGEFGGIEAQFRCPLPPIAMKHESVAGLPQMISTHVPMWAATNSSQLMCARPRKWGGMLINHARPVVRE